MKCVSEKDLIFLFTYGIIVPSRGNQTKRTQNDRRILYKLLYSIKGDVYFMKRKRLFCFTASLAMTAALLPQAVFCYAAEEKNAEDIVVLYTNDVHCAIDTNIGYAGLALYKREMGAQYENVLLVDAGDAIQGAPVGLLTEGKDIVSLMNAVGYDACVPGNHEFDYSVEVLLERNKELNCGYSSANFVDLRTEKPIFKPYQIVEAGDKNVAFVGVATPETFSSSAPAYFQDADGNYVYSFGEKDDALYETIQKGVDDARAEGADYVILLAHLGEHDVTESWSAPTVISHISGVDALIDGHSHETTPGITVKDSEGKEVVITQTGTKLNSIGKMVIAADGTIKTELVERVPEPDESMGLAAESWQTIEKSGEDAAVKYVDSAVQKRIDEINKSVSAQLDKKIGETAFKLYDTDPETGKRRVRTGETNVGNLCADAFLEIMGGDVAVVNGGGLRASIEKGDITYRKAMEVMPFGNMACLANVTGQQILDLLEVGAAAYPGESGSFMNVAGMTYMIDPDIESTVKTNDKGEFVEVSGARRVHSVMIGGEPLDPEKIYKLASHSYYLKNGGDGYIVSNHCELLRDSVISESDLIAVYIRDTLNGTIPERYSNPTGEGRIRFGAAPTENHEEPAETTAATTAESVEATTTTTAKTAAAAKANTAANTQNIKNGSAEKAPDTGDRMNTGLVVCIAGLAMAAAYAARRRKQ